MICEIGKIHSLKDHNLVCKVTTFEGKQ